VVCGRQWGKTSLGATIVVGEALLGKQCQWVAPSFPIGELGWNIIDRLCRKIPDTRFEGRPIFRITFATGGSIQLRSADNPDSLRGPTLDRIVFDEAAQAKPEAWPILRPTLSVRRGKALFISTPKGINWFHDLYNDADGRADWSRWRFPSTVSPYIPKEDVDEARLTMSSLMFSQEYEADFISAGSGMFRQEWFQHYHTTFEAEERFFMLGQNGVAESSCVIFHTVDLAWSQAEDADFTVISTWATTPMGHLILVDVNRGHYEGPDLIPQFRIAFERYGGVLYVEKATWRDNEVIKEAIRLGLPIQPVTVQKDKVARALPATARMEQMKVWFPPAKTLWFRDIEEELLAFPAGRHDDFVDTFSAAVIQAANTSAYQDRGLMTV